MFILRNGRGSSLFLQAYNLSAGKLAPNVKKKNCGMFSRNCCEQWKIIISGNFVHYKL
jgi:hypothetical protein